LHRFK